jgi:hypothetical protein
MTFDDCCRVILTSSRTSPAAKAYAKAGLGMSDPHAVAIQSRTGATAMPRSCAMPSS